VSCGSGGTRCEWWATQRQWSPSPPWEAAALTGGALPPGTASRHRVWTMLTISKYIKSVTFHITYSIIMAIPNSGWPARLCPCGTYIVLKWKHHPNMWHLVESLRAEQDATSVASCSARSDSTKCHMLGWCFDTMLLGLEPWAHPAWAHQRERTRHIDPHIGSRFETTYRFTSPRSPWPGLKSPKFFSAGLAPAKKCYLTVI
jgi:hypothetical protein